MAYQLYRNTTLGNSLQESLDELIQSLVNEEGAWATMSTESNPKILSTLLWNWLQQLSEPVLTQDDINLFCDGDWRQNLKKLSRSQAETLCCLLQLVGKLPNVPCTLEEKILMRLISALTKQPSTIKQLPPVMLFQLRSVIQEIRAQGIMSRTQRKNTDKAQHGQLNIEKTEGKIS